jgi:hypothetical protein
MRIPPFFTRLFFGHDVFISHPWEAETKRFVSELAAAMAKQGLDAWVDRESTHEGDHLPDAVKQAICGSNLFVVVINDAVVDATSDWMSRELDIAVENGRRILPIDVNRAIERLEAKEAWPKPQQPRWGRWERVRDSLQVQLWTSRFPGQGESADPDATMSMPDETVRPVLSRDGARLAVVGGGKPRQNIVIVWETETLRNSGPPTTPPTARATLTHTAPVRSIDLSDAVDHAAFSPDGEWVATFTHGGRRRAYADIRLIAVRTGTVSWRETISDAQEGSVSVSRDSRHARQGAFPCRDSSFSTAPARAPAPTRFTIS